MFPFNTAAAPFICNIPRSLVDGETVEQGRPTLVGHGLLGTAELGHLTYSEPVTETPQRGEVELAREVARARHFPPQQNAA